MKRFAVLSISTLCVVFGLAGASGAQVDFPDTLTLNVDVLDYNNTTSWPWEAQGGDSINVAQAELRAEPGTGESVCDRDAWEVCDTIVIHWIEPPSWDSVTEKYHIVAVYKVNLAGYEDNGRPGASVCDHILIHFKTPPELHCHSVWYHIERIGECVGSSKFSIELTKGKKVPSLTTYGLIVLAALLVLSAIWVMLRRRRVTVPA